MQKKIKCDWCGTYYDITKHNTCPGCGGTNRRIDFDSLDTNKFDVNKFMKIFLFCFIGIFVLVGITIFGLSGLTYKTVTKIVGDTTITTTMPITDDSKDTFSEEDNYDGYEYMNTSTTYIFTPTNKDYIKTKDGGEFVIASVWFGVFSETTNPNNLIVNLDGNIQSRDNKTHSVDLYVLKNNEKYKIVVSNSTFEIWNGGKTIDDLLLTSKENRLRIEGEVSLDNLNFEEITGFIVDIDGEEFKYDTKMSIVKGDGQEFDKTFNVSKTIDFDDNNRLYVNNLSCNYIGGFGGSGEFRIDLETKINNATNDNLRFFVEDEKNNLYELFYSGYDNDIYTFDDILKSSDSYNAYTYYYGPIINPTKLHVFVGDKESILELK